MFPCEISQQASRATLSIRFRAPIQELPQHFARVYGTLLRYLGEAGGQVAGYAFASYYNMELQDVDVEAGFPVAAPLAGTGDIRAGTIAAGTFAICHYTGPYNGIAPAYDTLTKYAEEHGYAPSGIAYEWYLNGPEVPPQELRTDVMFPVKPVAHRETA